MLNTPVPTPNIILNNDCSDNCTIVASNAGGMKPSLNQASDDDTASTQPSTKEKFSTSIIGNSMEDSPMGIFVSQHALPWGGKSANKLTAKWKRRIAEREKRRRQKEARNPRFRSRVEVWKQMVADGKMQKSANASLMFNTKRLVHLVKYALSDSGASSRFLIKGSPAVNVKIAEHPIAIKLPYGSIIWYSHTCNLDTPWLPTEMTEVHIVRGLDHSSLISTKKFCEQAAK
jgi:hypothetical protein